MNKKEILNQKLKILNEVFENIDESNKIFQKVKDNNLEAYDEKLENHQEPAQTEEELNNLKR